MEDLSHELTRIKRRKIISLTQEYSHKATPDQGVKLWLREVSQRFKKKIYRIEHSCSGVSTLPPPERKVKRSLKINLKASSIHN